MMNADKIRAIRLYKELTQTEFAKLAGVSLATIARIETGSLSISPRVKAKLARIEVDEGFFAFYEKLRDIS